MNCPVCGFDLSLIKRGKTSQENRLFHKLVDTLAMWRNVSPLTMKRYIKLYAASVHGYECLSEVINGKTMIEPKSIADATESEMREILIPTCQELAMDWGIPLEQNEV
jgi:hypothetical protein